MTGSFAGVIPSINNGSVELAIIQGDSIDFYITLYDSTGSTKTPISLAGKKALSSFRKSFSGDSLLEFSSTGGSITIGSTAGTLRFQKSSTVTSALRECDTGKWDVKLITISSGVVNTVSGGGFRVLPTATR